MRSRSIGTSAGIAPSADPGVGIARTYGGPGLGLIEVQASLSSSGGGRGKVVTIGVPKAEVQQILASLFRSELNMGELDRTLQIRLLGAEKYQRRYGLAVVVSLLSTLMRRPVPPQDMFLGEIDLSRNLRDIPPRVVESFLTCLAEHQFRTPLRVYASPGTVEALDGAAELDVRPCRTTTDVIHGLWPSVGAKKSPRTGKEME